MNENNHLKYKLQLPSARRHAESVQGELLPAETTIRETDTKGLNHPLLSLRQMREIQVEQQAIERQGATEVAMHQIELAVDKMKQDARMKGERERESLRSQHNVRCDSLATQAVHLGDEAIHSVVASHQRQAAMLEQSSCSPADKAMLSELFDQIGIRRIDKISIQHGGSTSSES
ncbi:MAG TPA: hypothetical protein DDZ51_11245 [Planctomycetaceae bacterium]|nr:hypothetical protein [Planctomycetaceae bacterium]